VGRVLRMLVLGVGLGIPSVAAPVSGQQPTRTLVTVDYVGVEGVYLPIGTDQGVSVRDTLVAYASATADAPGARLSVLSVSRRRSVAALLPGAMELERGGTIYIVLRSADDAAQTDPRTDMPNALHVADAPAPAAAGPAGPRVRGRMGLELDARESRTSWTGSSFGDTRRRLASSVGRLAFTASELPGAITVRGNLRAAYRYGETFAAVPAVSLRAYELSASRRFESVPMEVRVGRFYNPYERFSSYWDGVLMRAGGRAFGVGAAAGLEPSRSDEGFSTDLPKATAFADLRLEGSTWRYASDVSFHRLRGGSGYRRTFAGWSQSVRIGPLALTSDLRVDRPFGESPLTVGRLRMRGAVDVWGPLTLEAGFSRRRSGLAGDTLVTGAPVRDERSVGLSMRHASGGLSMEGTVMRWGDAPEGRSVAASLDQRTGRAWLRASGRLWARDDLRSLSLGPSAGGTIGPVDVQLSYRLYRTTRSREELSSHAVDLRLAFPLIDNLRTTVAGHQQWGTSLGGTRLQLGLWRAF